MKSSILRVAAACALAAADLAAQADVVTFNDFSSTSGLTLIGNAATATTGDGAVLRVTPAAGEQSGAAYSTSPITLGTNDTFSTTFKFRFTDPGGWDPADGITFVLAANPTGLGGAGVGIGYSGVASSVAIEFDTYNNAGDGLGDDDGDSSNHVSIDTGGNLTDADLVNVYGNSSCGFAGGNPAQNSYLAAGCMSNGDVWTATIGYDGSKLSLTLQDGSSAADVIYTGVPLDIAAELGTDLAYVGFTAGTGAGWENHDILSWQFANTTQLAPPPVPEPTSLALLAAGLGVVALAARRRRPEAPPRRA
jgi:hypothetical protein